MSRNLQHTTIQSFIYGLVDLDTRLVFYVGKTSTGMKRPAQHRKRWGVYEIAMLEAIAEPESSAASLCPWLPQGRKPTALNEAERYWIAIGRAMGWPLRNRTDGGDGMRIDNSPATRARMSESHTGKRHTEEAKAKIKAAAKARLRDPNANLGAASLSPNPSVEALRARLRPSKQPHRRRGNPAMMKGAPSLNPLGRRIAKGVVRLSESCADPDCF